MFGTLFPAFSIALPPVGAHVPQETMPPIVIERKVCYSEDNLLFSTHLQSNNNWDNDSGAPAIHDVSMVCKSE
jgi:hypothetical protein